MLVNMTRFFEILPYFWELESFSLIGLTALSLADTFFHIMFTLYLVSYVFQEIGSAIFNGDITYSGINDKAEESAWMFA